LFVSDFVIKGLCKNHSSLNIKEINIQRFVTLIRFEIEQLAQLNLNGGKSLWHPIHLSGCFCQV
jgi:hypothetical protein